MTPLTAFLLSFQEIWVWEETKRVFPEPAAKKEPTVLRAATRGATCAENAGQRHLEISGIDSHHQVLAHRLNATVALFVTG